MNARKFAVGFTLIALVVLSGCVSVLTTGGDELGRSNEPEPEAVFEGAFVHSDELEDLEGDRLTKMTTGNETVTELVHVEKRPYTDERSEVLEASDPTLIGNRYVSNATTNWEYDPDAQSAQYFEPAEPFDDDAIRSDRAEMAAEKLEMYDLEYTGTGRVADREAHVLAVEPKNETVEEGVAVLVGNTEFVVPLETADRGTDLDVIEWMIWIDTEYDYPLKETLIYEGANGERHEMTMAFETVTFNAGLGDETFAFDPPADTAVSEW